MSKIELSEMIVELRRYMVDARTFRYERVSHPAKTDSRLNRGIITHRTQTPDIVASHRLRPLFKRG